MAPSDDDKTVIQSRPTNIPPGDGNRTVMVPRPGAKSAAAPEPPTTPMPGAGGHAPSAPMASAAVTIDGDYGLNPLVAGATKLLAAVNKIQTSVQHNDVAGLHSQLSEEIRRFEVNARNANVSQEMIITARYVLCTVLDEAVMNTPWGSTSGWPQRSLLSIFHNEGFGGEKVFLIMQKLMEMPAANIDMLELMYVCLAMGFEGKFKHDPRGKTQLDQLREQLYTVIEKNRQFVASELSPHWQSTAVAKQSVMNYVPLWLITLLVLAALLVCYAGFSGWVYNVTEPASDRIENLLIEKNSDSDN